MEKLSVTIVTKNEAGNIARCLEAVKWADEILVVDSGSSDGTLDICWNFGCTIIETKWMGFGKTKKLAVEKAKYDWILSIDADEVVSQVLKDKILDILKKPKFTGYKINFISFYLDKKINHCGWKNGYKLRLFNRNHGNYNERILHEFVELDSEPGIIEEPVFHYSYNTIAKHFEKMNAYSDLASMQKFERKKTSTIIAAVLKGCLQFIKMYIFQLGFLDGRHGLVLALNSAVGIYMKYIKLWEKNNEQKKASK